MDIGGKKGIEPRLPVVRSEVTEAERSAEIQLPATSLPAVQSTPGLAPIGQLKLGELAARGKTRDVEGLFEISHPEMSSAKQHRVDQLVIGLSAAKLAPGTQKKFVVALERELGTDQAGLCGVKNELWQLIRRARELDPKLDVSILSNYFCGKDLRLLPTDELKADHAGYQVDRGAFRAELRAATADGVLDRGDALTLVEKLGNVQDREDLLWCQLQFSRLHDNGKFEYADDKTEQQIGRFFAGRLDGHASIEEVGWSLHRLRVGGFEAGDVAELRQQLAQNGDNADALFYAKRQLGRELKKASLQAEKLPEAERKVALAKIAKAKAALTPELNEAVAGKYDRYTVEKELSRQHRAGKLDDNQYLALHAAATTAETYEGFAYNAAVAQVALHLIQARGALLDAWSKANDEESERREEEQQRDGEVKRTEDRRLEEKFRLERVAQGRERLEVNNRRGMLSSRKERLLAALAGEPDPDRRASLLAGIAASDIQLIDLDEPLGQSH